jgi:hypothetical protein
MHSKGTGGSRRFFGQTIFLFSFVLFRVKNIEALLSRWRRGAGGLVETMRSHPMEGSDYRPVAVSPLHDDDVNSVVGSVNNDAEMVMTRRDENDEKIRCKAAAIRSLLVPPLESSGTVDLWKLRDMAITEYGLVDGEFLLITQLLFLLHTARSQCFRYFYCHPVSPLQ